MRLGWQTITPEGCLQQEILFLIRTAKPNNWDRRKETLGCIIKVDLRPYGRSGRTYGYDGDTYREATGLEKIFVMSGQCDVIIERYGR